MVMPKRLTGPRKVIALCDPAFARFPVAKTKMVDGREVPDIGLQFYSETLDIQFLGDLSKLPSQPTIFEILPLQTRHMSWDRGDDTDWALIFEYYCIGISDSPHMQKQQVQGIEHKTFTPESLETIPLDYIKDIAHKIIQLSKADGVTIPFSMLDTSADVLRRCRGAKFLNLSPVSTGDVKTSD